MCGVAGLKQGQPEILMAVFWTEKQTFYVFQSKESDNQELEERNKKKAKIFFFC